MASQFARRRDGGYTRADDLAATSLGARAPAW
jgi:hypothetical protein